ncbi:MAG TPA: energy transducer TonB [Gemmatimonadaceae bacterium]
MLTVWKVSYSRPQRLANAGMFSSATHVVIIALWVIGTLPPATMAHDSVANRLYYIPPPDRAPQVHGSTESIHYLKLVDGLGAGPGKMTIDENTAFTNPERSNQAGKSAPDTVAAPLGNTDANTDSVYTVLEVDSAVVRSQLSAAPAYPLELLKKNIEGSVVARYIVDTTGFADTTSFNVIRATNQEFVAAVRDALPYMRFSPAKMAGHKVRQLVEQGFGFKIAPGANPATPGTPQQSKPMARREPHPSIATGR